MKRLIIRNWIILLWRLEVPSSWQAGDLLAKHSYEVLSLKFQSESEGLRPRKSHHGSSSPNIGRLETQGEPLFHKFKGQKKTFSQLREVSQEEFPLI